MPTLIDILRAALPPDYTILKPLNRGGQGEVFLGRYRGHDVAIKAFNPHTNNESRIEREIDFLRNSNHDNLVKAVAAEKINILGDDCWVVSYEFFPDGDICGFANPRTGRVSQDEILNVGRDVSLAAEYMWQSRIVHRDIKPANILKRQNGRFVLCDVGVARHLDKTGVTAPGRHVGTAGYMSPEQARGRSALTIHSDMFSLGVTLYQIAAKAHPFNMSQNNIGRLAPPALETIRADLPKPLCQLIDQMMNPIPSRRPLNVSARIDTIMGR